MAIMAKNNKKMSALAIPTAMAAKAEEIRRILSEPVVDLWKLRELALTEGGLVNDSLRKLAWPKLVGVSNDLNASASIGSKNDSKNDVSTPLPISEVTIPPSLDAEQIERDVSRVTWHLLTGNQRSRNFQMRNKHRKRVSQLLKKKQRRLGDFLNLTLVQSYGVDVESLEDEMRLRYYQGFHDIGSIVLSALGGASFPSSPRTSPARLTNGAESSFTKAQTAAESMGMSLACEVLLKMSQHHLRDPMRANFIQLQTALRLVLMPLIAAFDAEMHSHLFDCDMEPFFALSWVITWFAHDVRDTAVVKRLFDFFLVSHPMMPIYMSVAMTIHPLNRVEILGTDCDFACVHNALANLPKNSNDVGWKYIQGDISCYVDNDEDVSVVSLDPSLQATDDDSVISSTSPKARVPFQELIDLSISLMHKIPPRNLINLAQRYHNDVSIQPLLADSSSIALFQPPPSWGLAPTAESDWVVRQRMWKEQGTKLNRHQRKNRQKLLGTDYVKRSSAAMSPHHHSEKGDKRPLQAVIASGTGPDGRAEARKLRKKRKMLAQSVVVVVFSLVALLSKSYFLSTPIPSQKQSPVQILESGSLMNTPTTSSNKSSLHEQQTMPKDVQVTASCEEKHHRRMKSLNEAPRTKLNPESLPAESTVKNAIPQNEVPKSDIEKSTAIVVKESAATSITKVPPNPLKGQLGLALAHIKMACHEFMSDIEDEISAELDDSVPSSAEAAQKVWRRQQERIVNLGKEFLARARQKLVVLVDDCLTKSGAREYIF